MEERIEKRLNTNIKDLIKDFPQIQDHLDKFDIGCAPCNLGTCKLKDIVGIHNLSIENEKELIKSIFEIIYPGESFDIPRLGHDKVSTDQTPSMPPPIKMLIDEHKLIKRVLNIVPHINEVLDLEKAEHRNITLSITDFIKEYADRYHHAKEEDILFALFDQSLDIIQVMYSDHKTGRQYVSNMIEAVENKNTKSAILNLSAYSKLLTEHIHKEDDILYPWIVRNLTDRQIGEIYSAFYNINNERNGIQDKYEKLVSELEIFLT